MQRVPPWSVPEGRHRVEIEPPGFADAYLGHLIVVIIVGAVVVPLALVGVLGAFLFHDFGAALRVAMGLAGAVAGWLFARAVYRLLVRAFTQRSRIRSAHDGVFVESKRGASVESVWLSPRSGIEVSAAGSGLVLRRGETSIVIAEGHVDRHREELRSILLAAVAAGAQQPAGQPSPQRLGPTWGQWWRGLLRDVVRPLRQPTPFLVVDLAMIILAPIVSTVVLEAFDPDVLYGPAFALFLVGLALRRFDRSYVLGMRYHAEYTTGWTFGYGFAGFALSLSAALAIQVTFRLGLLSLLLGLGLCMGLHVAMLRRAAGSTTPRPVPKIVDMALAATLVPLSVLHESAAFFFIGEGVEDLGPLALALAPTTVVVAYLPVRLHAFADDPGDQSNRVWFWITSGWLTLISVFGWV